MHRVEGEEVWGPCTLSSLPSCNPFIDKQQPIRMMHMYTHLSGQHATHHLHNIEIAQNFISGIDKQTIFKQAFTCSYCMLVNTSN